MMIRKTQQGFTLIELMIVIAIIGILAAIAVPQYNTYTKRAKFSEVTMAVTPVKTAIEVCMQTKADAADGIDDCDTVAEAGFDLTAAASGALVASVGVGTTTGAITATGDATAFGAGMTYILTPTVTANTTTITGWTTSGTCTTAGIC